MKKTGKLIAASVLAASLIGGSSVWGASLSQGVIGSDDQLLTDVSTYAGAGDFGSHNEARLFATFRTPTSIALTNDGSLLVSDSRNQLIRKISGAAVSTLAGLAIEKDLKGFPIGGLLDGKTDLSLFQDPAGLAIDASGSVYIADSGNHAIRKMDTAGNVTTMAGNGRLGSKDGTGAEATFYNPKDVAAAKDGTVYVADTLNHVIRSISPSGQVKTLTAPSSRIVEVAPGQAITAGDFADGDIQSAKFNEPSGLAIDDKGNLYVSDSGNQRIRYIDFGSGKVTTVAGSSMASNNKDVYEKTELYAIGDYADGAASAAKFDFPGGIALTDEGGLVIADTLNHSVRYLLGGRVTTLAGDSRQKTGETDGIDRAAQFQNPTDVAVAADGSVYVADSYNNKIRRIDRYELPADLPQDDENVKVVLGPQWIQFEVQPEIANDRTMVPVRAITEALGYEVGFEENSQTVRLTKGSVSIELVIGSTGIKKIEKDTPDVIKETDVAPYIKDGSTYVPVRFFAEEIGLGVSWEPKTRTAILRQKTFE
jgi:sugar lactone lactonase YvrE